MKCSLILFVLIAFVLPLPSAGSRRPHFFNGACGARLADTIHMICENRGVRPMNRLYFFRRYRKARFQSNLAGRHRGKRDVDYMSMAKFPKRSSLISFDEERESLSMTVPKLTALVKAGSAFNEERTARVRVRRQVSQKCCLQECSQHYISRYCGLFKRKT